VNTVIFHLDALTGEDASSKESDNTPQGIDIISGPVVEAYLLDHDDSKVILLLDESLQVYLLSFSSCQLNETSLSGLSLPINPTHAISPQASRTFTLLPAPHI